MTDLRGFDVSRETRERLEIYSNLLKKWNPKINLVSRSTMGGVWKRHFADSAQLTLAAPEAVRNWVDLGSGGGFPGLVVAIMAMERKSPERVILVESDLRKAAFLRAVIRETGAPAEVLTRRIEALEPMGADILSARALAPLTNLLAFAERHLRPDGFALFPKGGAWKKEIHEARQRWKFDSVIVKSKTCPDAVILRISGVSRV